MNKILDVLNQTDWTLLSQQKLWLLAQSGPEAEGLLYLLDALQDAAVAAGYPVVWLHGVEV